jgi:hypothetical protein
MSELKLEKYKPEEKKSLLEELQEMQSEGIKKHFEIWIPIIMNDPVLREMFIEKKEEQKEKELKLPEAAENFAKWICMKHNERASILMHLINKCYKEEPKFKVGDVWRARDGELAKILYIRKDNDFSKIICISTKDELCFCVNKEGRANPYLHHTNDLIEKVSE